MIKFYRYYWIYFVISAFFILPGLFSLITHGLKLGIDFTGGSLLTVQATEATQTALLTENNIRTQIGHDHHLVSVKTTSDNQVILRLSPLNNEEKKQILTQINQLVLVEQVNFDSVGATLGRELITKTIYAVIIASVILVLYLKYRFHEFTFGWAAFLGVVHDVLIICGIFSLLGWKYGIEIDTLFVTALLTTISFSVHDTVVIYDRIRELKQKFPQATLHQVAEAAVAATISRSFNNSLTVFFMLLALLVLGGVTLRYFALALLLGVFFGTYSSPFHSIPLLLLAQDRKWFVKKEKKR